MFDFLRQLFSADFMPHGHCYFWRPQILWLHVMADAFITFSYYSIPVALIYLVRRRRDVAFEWIFVMFGVFICACGTTHLMEIITVWNPVYRLAGLVKAVTAIASVATAAVLWGLMPRLVGLPSPAQLRESNARLEAEVVARRAAEAALVTARDELEERVRERTTELARANKELRESQGQMQAILDHSPAVIFLKDRASRFLLVNRAFEQLFDTTNEAARGKTIGDFVPPAMAAAREANDAQVFTTGQPLEVEELVPRNGETLSYLSIKFPLLGPDGKAYAICGISSDRTERKRAELAIQQSREEAERANNAKSEFLSRVSHELRTPLNAILGFAQILEMEGPRDDQRSSIAPILRGGRHLLALINEVLDIARVDAGEMTFSPEPVNACELFRESLDLMRPLAAPRRIELEGSAVAATQDAYGWVRADRQRLKQVLVNLLSNAVKFNREGGRVSVGCEVSATERLRLTVHDTGPGIAPADQARLFSPFDRLGAERQGIEGTGLGLALTKRLVELMGGRIGYEAAPSGGSTFWVELPRAATPVDHLPADTAEASFAAVNPADASAVEPVGPPQRTVLYIEDNLSNLNLVTRLLDRRRDVRLIPAMQGGLGLDLAREHRPDLILLDLHLPDLSGREVLRRLRADAATREVPVVVISADATPREIDATLAAGARAYLTKPLDVHEFLRTLDDQLGPAEETATNG